ncbi:MAG: polysaccharide biosynthesis/export family protein [Cocleimonas sp.]
MKFFNLKTSIISIFFVLLVQLSWAEGEAKKVINDSPDSKTSTSEPFGSKLFTGNFQSNRNDGLDPNYRLIAGDKVALHMWGQVTIDEILTVDAKGNIFIPEVGQVKVMGARSTEIQKIVKAKVATVFKEGEGVYANLVTTTPISVYVTGSILKPGQYTGIASHSVLSYLFKAGGIDPKRGSYRDVRVLRQGRVIARYDLYPFLRKGQIKHIKFRDGDTIVVGELASTINVVGDSLNSFRFEFQGRNMLGKQLIQFARPDAKVTHIAIAGTRNRKPWSVYLPYKQFLNTRLLNGDTVKFTSDALTDVMGIKVEGSHLGKSFYSVKKGTRLTEILDYIEVDQDSADIKNIYLKRLSIVKQQKKNLDESIRRLRKSVLIATSSSSGEASIRTQEANLVLKFIDIAQKTVPEGRVVVSENGKTANIRMEDGDIIVIPQKSDIVTVSGEVLIPKSVVYARNASIEDYIHRSGGFTERADKTRIVVMHPNGSLRIGSRQAILPGDQLIVFPRIDEKRMQNARDILQVLSQIAISASVLGF